MNKALILTLMIMSGTSMIACNEGSDSGATPQAATPAPPPVAPVSNPTAVGTPEAPLLTGAQLQQQVEDRAAEVAQGLDLLTGQPTSIDNPVEGGDALFTNPTGMTTNSVTAPAARSLSGFVPAAASR